MCSGVTRSTLVGFACKLKSQNKSLFVHQSKEKYSSLSGRHVTKSTRRFKHTVALAGCAARSNCHTVGTTLRFRKIVSHEMAQRWQQQKMRNATNITTLHYYLAEIRSTQTLLGLLQTHNPLTDEV